MANRLNEYLAEIRTIDGLKNAILCGITVSKKDSSAEFFLVTDKTYSADEEVKARTLLEAEAAGHKIVYRRVKRVNELVIDGKVYDEYVALLEFAHTLKACVDGHTIEAGIANSGQSFIVDDGQIITQKLRFF